MKYILYSNYYGWINEEDVKQELIDCQYVECEEEITDEMIWDMNEEELHTKMWNNNFMTGLPHFARDVYECKE